MVPYAYLYELYSKDRPGLYTLATVTALCLFLDPAVGLILGICIAHMANAARTLANEYISYEVLELKGSPYNGGRRVRTKEL